MPGIMIYSGSNCPWCARAKALLEKKGAAFEDVDVKADAARYEEMLSRTHGQRTIPQIFINGAHIGGCDDLFALDAAGKLDTLLAG